MTFTQRGLFDEPAAVSWWASLATGIAAAATLESKLKRENERRRKISERVASRQKKVRAPQRQSTLNVAPDPVVPLPKTVGDCRGPGICPVLRCQYNVLLDIRKLGGTESIAVGGRGGTGEGYTLAGKRNSAGQVEMADLDAMVDAILDIVDRVPSTCTLDYADDPDLIPGRAEPDTGGPWNPVHMTLHQVGVVFGLTRERIRLIEHDALERSRLSSLSKELDPAFVPAGALSRKSPKTAFFETPL